MMQEFELSNEDRDRIEQEHAKVIGNVADGKQNWPAMSYEQGVDAALSWILGDREEPPFSGA